MERAVAVPFDANKFRQQMTGNTEGAQAAPQAQMAPPQAPVAPQGQPQQYQPTQALQPVPQQFAPVAPPPHPQAQNTSPQLHQPQMAVQQAYAPRPYPQAQPPHGQQPQQTHAPMQPPAYTQPPVQSASHQMPQGVATQPPHMHQGNMPLQPRMFTPPPSVPTTEADAPRKKKFSLKRRRRAKDKPEQGVNPQAGMARLQNVGSGQSLMSEVIEPAPELAAKAGKPPALVFAAGLALGVVGTVLSMTLIGGITGSKVDQRIEQVAAVTNTEIPVEEIAAEGEAKQDFSALQNQLKVAEGLNRPND